MDGVSPAGRVSGGSSSAPPFANAGRVAVDTMANLALDTWDAGKARVQSRRDAIQNRIAETFGGHVASAIRSPAEESGSTAEPTFGGDSLAKAKTDEGGFDPTSEIAVFRGREPRLTTTQGCYPYELATWRLRQYLLYDRGDLWTRAANLHSRTPRHNTRYRSDLRTKAAKWATWLAA